jgi:hypothetical protein
MAGMKEDLDDEDDKQNGEMVSLDEGDEKPEQKNAPEDEKDERLSADQRDDDDEGDREEIRARRREEKRNRKAAQRDARDRTQRELVELRRLNAELMSRVSSIEGNAISNNVSSLEGRIREAAYRAQQAEEALAKAVEAGNGEVVRDALRLRDKAINEATTLETHRRAIIERAQRPPEPKMDPLVERNARGFIERNKDWYDPNGGNDDSAVVMALDNKIASEGFDPTSEEYWEELEKRASKMLPHRFNSEDAPEPQRARRGPPTGGRGDAPSSSRNQVFVSAERKQAMMEAGIWDDPKLRRDALRRYAEFDRNSAR